MKKIYHILILFSLALWLNGCFSLDQEPTDKVRVGNSFSSAQEVQFWVNGVYNSLRQSYQGKPMYISDLQADFLNLMSSSRILLYRDFHRWSQFQSGDASIRVIWQTHYGTLANVNAGLQGIETMPADLQEEVKVLKGELYLARAYCHTYLAAHFCKAYDPSTAASDLGLPLADHIVTTQTPLQSTLEQTYQFILSDIAQAETLLASKAGIVGADTFTADAAKALKARVLLYKQEWAQAYQVAKELIDTNRYPLVTSQSDLQDLWTHDTDNESIVQLYAAIDGVSVSERPFDTNSLYLDEAEDFFNPGQFILEPNVVPTQDFVDLFDNTDWRKEVYLREGELSFGQTIYVVNKYPRNIDLSTPSDFFPYYGHKPKLLRIAETYLIAAEAAYRNNDEANALVYLNALRAGRGLGNLTVSGTNLFTEIQNERNRELCFEDFRLIDLKRWGLGVKRGTPQNFTLIATNPANELHQLNLPAGYYKMVWPVPQIDVNNEHGRWKQNPGW